MFFIDIDKVQFHIMATFSSVESWFLGSTTFKAPLRFFKYLQARRFLLLCAGLIKAINVVYTFFEVNTIASIFCSLNKSYKLPSAFLTTTLLESATRLFYSLNLSVLPETLTGKFKFIFLIFDELFAKSISSSNHQQAYNKALRRLI